MLSAQDLPRLKDAPGITRGCLQNGAEYYIVENHISKGHADFALVQKNRQSAMPARKALQSLSNFAETSPYRFLASKGVGYSRDGYAREFAGSTVFSFSDVPTFDSAAADSTLLILFDTMRECADPQAVIISGDVNATKLIDRMHVLSMTVGRLPDGRTFTVPYSWKPSEKAGFAVNRTMNGLAATITVSFSAPRTPSEFMGTTQPLVSSMFADEFGTIVRKRLRTSFREAGIPVAGMDFRYSDSSMGAGDEEYSVSVLTDGVSAVRATELIAAELGRLEARGATMEEYQYAKDRLLTKARKLASKGSQTNAEMVDRCVSAYLFNSSLAAQSTVSDFYTQRRLSSDQEVELFNNFLSALLDVDQSCHVRYDVPASAASEDAFRGAFGAAWRTAMTDSSRVGVKSHAGDTLALASPRKKVRIKTDTADPITGGRVLTFSNGIKVVWKKMDTAGQFEFALLQRGGYTLVPKLGAGEQAFVQDMLGLSRVAGMPSSDFRSMLRDNGIDLETKVTASNFEITGSAPVNKLSLLLKSLLSLASSREPDAEAFEYYTRCEAVRIEAERHSESGLVAFVDSLRRPDYIESTGAQISFLRKDLPSRADKYFSSRFSNLADGVLVLIGDFDETALQKTLCRYLGEFSTANSFTQRPRMQGTWRDGWYSLTRTTEDACLPAGSERVIMSMSADVPFTMDSYMTFELAKVALRREVVSAMADYGMAVEVEDVAELFPREMFTIRVSCSPCNPDGLPSGVRVRSLQQTQQALRAAVMKVSREKIPAAALKGYKSELSSRMASDLKRPEVLLNASLVRYAQGKDVVSQYEQSIQSVTADGIQSMLSKLESGCKIELVLR